MRPSLRYTSARPLEELVQSRCHVETFAAADLCAGSRDVRVVALLIALPICLKLGVVGKARLDWKNVAVWGIGDSVASLLFVAAADRGPVAVAGVLAAQFATVGVIVGMVVLKDRLRLRQFVTLNRLRRECTQSHRSRLLVA